MNKLFEEIDRDGLNKLFGDLRAAIGLGVISTKDVLSVVLTKKEMKAYEILFSYAFWDELRDLPRFIMNKARENKKLVLLKSYIDNIQVD